MTAIPLGWGEDELSAFFGVARNNLHASFLSRREWYGLVRDIDAVFLALLGGMTDPESVPAAFLAFRSHSAYRAAGQLALSGQGPESFMVMRGCLEHALYAHHLALHPATWDIWTRRGESDKARQLCSREFSGRNILASLDTRNLVLGGNARALYERTIDFGAHPNELAVGGSFEVTEHEDETRYTASYVSCDGPALLLAIKSAAQTGLIVLDILCHLFPSRAQSQRIQEQLLPLKCGM